MPDICQPIISEFCNMIPATFFLKLVPCNFLHLFFSCTLLVSRCSSLQFPLDTNSSIILFPLYYPYLDKVIQSLPLSIHLALCLFSYRLTYYIYYIHYFPNHCCSPLEFCIHLQLYPSYPNCSYLSFLN